MDIPETEAQTDNQNFTDTTKDDDQRVSEFLDDQVKPLKPAAAPIKRVPGKSLLPLARVQRIMKADKLLPACAKEATVLISIATEEFIMRLVEAGYSQASREKRSTIQQKDVVVAIKRHDEMLFLEEILSIPVAPPANKPRTTKPKPTPPTDTRTIVEAFKGQSSRSVSVKDAAGDPSGTQYVTAITLSQPQPDTMDTS